MTKPQKFKIGDAVVVARCLHQRDLSWNKDYPQVGEVVTIERIEGSDSTLGFIYWFHEKTNGRYEAELELAEFANSPLWEALK